MMLKEKREGTDLAFKTFIGSNGTRYLVFRSLEGSFHVFTEVEAKQAAKDCGAAEGPNTRQMWESLWSNQA
jgi:Arc/MetJ family transcription regulator